MLTQYSKHSYHSGDFDAWKLFPKAAREQGCAEPRGTGAADPCWLRAGQAAPGPEELGGTVCCFDLYGKLLPGTAGDSLWEKGLSSVTAALSN